MIDIILATYNGAKFLEEQLNSIVNSARYDELVSRVIVTDDKSSDNTADIVDRYRDKKVTFQVNTGFSGVCNNFLNGLKESSAEYVMFCDQDDIWMPEKIERSYVEMIDLESKKGKDLPLVCFCDLEIVDDKLNFLEKSFFEYHNIKLPERLEFEKIVLNNIMPGCSSIINKSMVNHVLNGREYINDWIMHDWWIMLIATRLGSARFIPEPLMKYRQHANNVVGYQDNSFFKKMLKLRVTCNDYNESMRKRISQYRAFISFLENNNCLKDENKKVKINISFAFQNECTIKRKILSLNTFLMNGICNE